VKEEAAMTSENQTHPDTRHSGAQKVYFVCFTDRADAPLHAIEETLPAHKAWAAEAEAAGQLFVAGPFLDDDFRYTGSGMIVLRAKTRAEAEAIAAADPMHAKGLRQYRLVPWQLNEGTLPIQIRLSTGTVTFD
jgi:uncharacterized protein YciI